METTKKKNKDCFPSYESARFAYDNQIAPNFGATRLEVGFGRWLWLDVVGLDVADRGLATWIDMEKAGILTQAGRKALAKAIKKAEVKQ